MKDSFEPRTLLEITSDDENNSFGVKIRAEGIDDLYKIAVGIYKATEGNLGFLDVLLSVFEGMGNPDIRQRIDENTIEVPDFNELLKHGNAN
jgi:hypothetical protein